ncbi:MAG: hypothetical protein GAK28_02411 [Luteibacter sp.]|uniref:hypothetical protein n=1 Tax=Luteibacter sp. TaxID=1886636 RepID=UPI00137F9EC6|nr:hypothetical protein [Luteibacter sp.]KAF1006735.1 MAG: hypothetical protein GAK28_02411 [Luteibacter sp.]
MTLTPEMVETALGKIAEAQTVLRELDAGLRKARAQDWAGHGPHEMNVAGCLVRDGAWVAANSGLNDVYAMLRAQSQRAAGVEAKLDAPAKVGAVVFSKGVSWSSVIACAQRAYAHKDDPNPSAEDVEKLRALIDRVGGGS